MKVTYDPLAGLSLDILREIEDWQFPFIEPEMIIDVSKEFYDKWVANYNEACELSSELHEIFKTQHEEKNVN